MRTDNQSNKYGSLTVNASEMTTALTLRTSSVCYMYYGPEIEVFSVAHSSVRFVGTH